VKFDYQFQYIAQGNSAGYRRHVSHSLGLSYNLFEFLPLAPRVEDIYRALRMYIRFLRARVTTRPLVKDPIAVFSAEWLASTFDMQVVVMIRHPAAFASSIRRLEWSHPFSHFLDQPLLMHDHLYPFETELREYVTREHNCIDQAALLWRLIYHVILKYRDRHPDWIFVRHEDLSRDPVTGFESLFHRLGLRFSDRHSTIIQDHSSTDNPEEPIDPYSIMRDTRSNLWNWKKRLTDDQIQRIRSQVQDISSVLYAPSDW
jgi:hypothetical protein